MLQGLPCRSFQRINCLLKQRPNQSKSKLGVLSIPLHHLCQLIDHTMEMAKIRTLGKSLDDLSVHGAAGPFRADSNVRVEVPRQA